MRIVAILVTTTDVVERKYRCIDGKRHYYNRISKKCYKCNNTKEENDTKVGDRIISATGERQSQYQANKNWRMAHPKLRYSGKERYYKKHRKYDKRRNKRYTYEEEQLILTRQHNDELLTDVKIAQLLKRSVQAIQMKRVKLTN